MKKNNRCYHFAFTLAEVMIVLIVIGVLSVVLFPMVKDITPSDEIVRFQRANQALLTGIKMMTSESKDGDLGLDKNGNVITNPRHFCNILADFMTTKSVNCSDDNLGYNSSGVVIMDDFATYEFSDGTTIYDTADCICKKHTSSGEEILLNDGIVIYTVNPYYHFGVKDPKDNTRIFNTKSLKKQYKYICIDIDGINKGQEPFGYALGADGKIVFGSRAKVWSSKSIQDKSVDNSEISSIDSCPLVSYETNVCGDAAAKITFNGKDYCITKYNLGDHDDLPIPATVTIAQSKPISSEGTSCNAEEDMCCWQGTTGAGVGGGNAQCDLGEYCCNSTVCNELAAQEMCSKLTYQNKRWRLVTLSEINTISTLIDNGQINFEDMRTAPDSGCWYSERCLGADENICMPNSVWLKNNEKIGYSYTANNGQIETNIFQRYDARFVRCIAEL